MEWGRAKKFVVVLLVLLNVALAGLNYRQQQANTMTAAQEKAIFEVLSENGITLYTDLKTEAKPMFRLEAEVPVYSKETLELTFLEGKKSKVSPGVEKSVYKTDTRTLTVQGGTGVLTMDNVEKGASTRTRADVLRDTEEPLEGIKELLGSMTLNSTAQIDEGWRIEYCGSYEQETVFANHVTFYVSDNGVYKITFSYAGVTGYSSERKSVCLVDEALLAFMRDWKKQGQESDAAIQKIELGYDILEQGGAITGSRLYLEPCYRIHLMGVAEPVVVNAYTCQVVEKIGK